MYQQVLYSQLHRADTRGNRDEKIQVNAFCMQEDEIISK